jgi:uncharacterized protein (DUF427 family)
MPKGESLFHKYPDHRVDLEPSDQRIRVRAGGEIVADSARTLTVRESRRDPVSYFPRDDVRLDRLESTDHETFCPFKGEASYWSVKSGDAALENSVWSYEDPFPEVAGLKDYVAFYADRFEFERDE